MSKTRPLPPPPSLAPHQQAQAAALIVTLKRQLLEECPDLLDDPRAWLDTLDGQSGAIDTIRRLIRGASDADLLAEAIRQRQAERTGSPRNPATSRLSASARARSSATPLTPKTPRRSGTTGSVQ